MPKVAVNLNNREVEELVEQLDMAEKIRLVRKLEQETRSARWNPLIGIIRQRAVKNSLSEREIKQICEKVRKERYERNKSRN